jgi:hypothetical protein
MQYTILFALIILWFGAGSWVFLNSNNSGTTRLLGFLTLLIGIGVLSYSV